MSEVPRSTDVPQRPARGKRSPSWTTVMRNGFLVVVTLTFLYVAIQSQEFPALAGLYPRFIAILGLVLGLSLLWTQFRQRSHRAEGSGAQYEIQRGEQDRSSDRRAFRYFGWLIILMLLFWVIGAVVGSAVFIVAFLVVETKTHWLVKVVGPLIMVGILVTFAKFMGLVWPTPLIPLLG